MNPLIHNPTIYENLECKPYDLQGWNSEHPIFEALISECNPKTIIEVGTWKGASACNMARLAPEAHIWCVDTWLGGIDHMLSDLPQDDLSRRNGYPQIYFQFLSNVMMLGFEKRITPVIQTSHGAAKIFAHFGQKADLIYIDASHEFEDVRKDIGYFFPLTNKIIFGDDYQFTAVKDAVHSCFGNSKDLNVIDNNFWVYRKGGYGV